MQILIVSDTANLADANSLSHQLQRRCSKIYRIIIDDLAEQSSYSLELTSMAGWILRWQQQNLNLAEISLVLYLCASQWPDTSVPSQIATAEEFETILHQQALLSALQLASESTALWCNTAAARQATANPIRLYHWAQQAGLRIPASLSSNEAQRIRDFIRDCGGRVLATALSSWYPRESQENTGATILSLAQCEFDDALFYSPALYQELIDVKYSVKVLITASVVSAYQVSLSGNLQMAHGPCSQFAPCPLTISQDQIAQWQHFLQIAGLKLATLDFVIDQQHTWWFIGISDRLHLHEMQQARAASTLVEDVADMLLHSLNLPAQKSAELS